MKKLYRLYLLICFEYLRHGVTWRGIAVCYFLLIIVSTTVKNRTSKQSFKRFDMNSYDQIPKMNIQLIYNLNIFDNLYIKYFKRYNR